MHTNTDKLNFTNGSLTLPRAAAAAQFCAAAAVQKAILFFKFVNVFVVNNTIFRVLACQIRCIVYKEYFPVTRKRPHHTAIIGFSHESVNRGYHSVIGLSTSVAQTFGFFMFVHIKYCSIDSLPSTFKDVSHWYIRAAPVKTGRTLGGGGGGGGGGEHCNGGSRNPAQKCD